MRKITNLSNVALFAFAESPLCGPVLLLSFERTVLVLIGIVRMSLVNLILVLTGAPDFFFMFVLPVERRGPTPPL